MEILAVGIATIDIISIVAQYPQQDAEVRAEQRRIVRGGNATNTLVVLAQLQHSGHWAGMIADDAFAAMIQQDLCHYHIDTTQVTQCANAATPVSAITVSRASGSRSIVHYRALAEYRAERFAQIPLEAYQWVHFEGRNIVETEKMLRKVQQYPQITCSLEVEKNRAGIASLLPYAHIVLFSKNFAQCSGFDDGQAFMQHAQAKQPQAVIVCAWGAKGAYGVMPGGAVQFCPARPITVIDSVGAGDVFNAGFIHAFHHTKAMPTALAYACRLAEKKCAQLGFAGLS